MKRFALSLLLPLTLLACARGPGFDGVRTPLWALDGDAIAHARRHRSRLMPNAPERFDLYVANAWGLDPDRVLKRVDTAGLRAGALSPDGRSLACAVGTGARQDLVIVDLRTGDRERLLEDEVIDASTICWDAAGRRIALTLGEPAMVGVVDTWTREIERSPSAAPRVMGWVGRDRLALASEQEIFLWTPGLGAAPAWLHAVDEGTEIRSAQADDTGRRMAVLTATPPVAGAHLTVIDLRSGRARTIWESPQPLVGIRWVPGGEALLVSRLGRTRGSGWELQRIAMSDGRHEAVAEHRAGCDVSPDGSRLVVSTGQSLITMPLPSPN
jgi:dipeptidyl aminopeptidase/acylaminoacyl peptidase